MAPLTLLVLVAATARLTRIVTADTVTDPLRLRVFRRFPPKTVGRYRAHWIGQLVDCHWCAGFWVAGAVVGVAAAVTPVPLPWLTWPAVASLASMLTAVLDRG